MDFIQIAISARLAHGDLVTADAGLEAGPADHNVREIFIKQLLISCANVSDLDGVSRGLYKDHPELNRIIAPHRRGFEFTKYIRNIAVGHVNPALCRKAIEWRPELNAVLAAKTLGAHAFLSYAVLETAINTFVDGDRHRVFDSETDLAYPPDLTRFLNYVGETVHAGIAYCEALAVIAVERAALPGFNDNLIDLAFKAGQTDFKYITRKADTG